jgi:hypothetical protein
MIGGSRVMECGQVGGAGDPPLRLKNGCAQDDAGNLHS